MAVLAHRPIIWFPPDAFHTIIEVNDIFHVKFGIIIRLFENSRIFNPFKVVVTTVLSMGVATKPLPLLSFHCVTDVPDFLIVDVSAASNHRTHPEIVGAPRPEFRVDTI